MRPGAGKSAVRPVSVIHFKYNYEPEDARVINGESIWSIVMLDSNLYCNISKRCLQQGKPYYDDVRVAAT